MHPSRRQHRRPLPRTARTILRLSVLAGLAASLIAPIPVSAEGEGTTLLLTPHCILRDSGEENTDGRMFGRIPTTDELFGTNEENDRCREFAIENPQMMKTDPLSEGDTLDMDLIIRNPGKKRIKRVRAWLAYDPNVLEGKTVTVNESLFPAVTPGESDFSGKEGYVKIEASTQDPDKTTGEELLVARIEFTVHKVLAGGTVIGFHDVQSDGHTLLIEDANGEERSALEQEPGVLVVVTVQEEEPGNDEGTADRDTESSGSGSSSAPDGRASSSAATTETEEEIGTGGEVSGVNRTNGEDCNEDAQCASGLCGSGICIPKLSTGSTGTGSSAARAKRTAFSLLQVRNVSITTEGSSLFVAWDELKSSELKAYNVYYGTTSGQYIQRKTVGKSEISLTIRALPADTTYYVAVRAVNHADEESAFSQEVAVTVGDPASSTAPLAIGTGDALQRPLVGTVTDGNGGTIVPGETGLPTVLAILLIASAAVGTAVASRRQHVAIAPPSGLSHG